MSLSKAPRLDRTPLLRSPSFLPGSHSCRLHALRRAEVRVRRSSITPRAIVSELSLLDSTVAAANLVFSSAPDPQKLTIAVIGTTGLVIAAAISLSSQVSPSSKRAVSLSPAKLIEVLSQKEALFVDIRSKKEAKAMGSPSLKGLAARSRTFPFTKATKDGQERMIPGFGEAFAKMKGLREDTVVVLMDGTGRQVTTAAQEILKFADFKAVYCVSGGAAALEASGFKWQSPSSRPSFSLPKVNLKGFDLDKVAESYKQRPTLFNSGLAVGALATAAVVLFNEFDIVLETVGVLGGTQLLFKRFFFAEDREKTIRELRSLFDDKIAPAEAGDDLKRLASTILEVTSDPQGDGKESSTSAPAVVSGESTDKVPISKMTF